MVTWSTSVAVAVRCTSGALCGVCCETLGDGGVESLAGNTLRRFCQSVGLSSPSTRAHPLFVPAKGEGNPG